MQLSRSRTGQDGNELPFKVLEGAAGRRKAGHKAGWRSGSFNEVPKQSEGVAVPVLVGGQAVASLAIISPATRAARIAEGVEALQEGTERIATCLLGAQPVATPTMA